jgi:two-component system, OmpR family, phosphate regulon sensor histidine kinase PhoR
MGFGQWFWRLFFVFAGLILAHVLIVTWLVVPTARSESGAAFPYAAVWLAAGAVLAAGAATTWYCVGRIVKPLAELSRNVRTAARADGSHPLANQRDEVGLLAGAFDQMQRDLARRLDQFQQNSQRLETVLSSMAEGVLAIGPDKSILLANEAGRQLLDFATPSPVGRSLLEVTRSRPVHEAADQAFRNQQPVTVEFEAPGVSRRTLSLRATRLPGDPCPGVMVVLHDMTELRRLENLRRELVANVSHELKTPLAAIKGYAETLRLGAVNDQEHNLHFVRRIEEQADRLHELILDILRIARLEAEQESFELTDVCVATLLDQCAGEFAELAAAKQITLTTELPPAACQVVADQEGLRTLLSNLVDNALKYTPAGGSVVLRADADQQTVTLEIQDTGIGIAASEHVRIFERFYRVDRARSRDLGGTGLGLSIVKHLAQAFGGSVTVESQPGRGSTFRVQLPRSATNRP